MYRLKKRSNWVNAMLDGFMPAWRFQRFPHYHIIEMFCPNKETFPVYDSTNKVYVNIDFFDPRYVYRVFGLSDDRSFYNPEAKTFLENIEKLINEAVN